MFSMSLNILFLLTLWPFLLFCQPMHTVLILPGFECVFPEVFLYNISSLYVFSFSFGAFFIELILCIFNFLFLEDSKHLGHKNDVLLISVSLRWCLAYSFLCNVNVPLKLSDASFTFLLFWHFNQGILFFLRNRYSIVFHLKVSYVYYVVACLSLHLILFFYYITYLLSPTCW